MKNIISCGVLVFCFFCGMCVFPYAAFALAPPSLLSGEQQHIEQRNTLVMRAIEERAKRYGPGPLGAGLIKLIQQEVAAAYPDVRWFGNTKQFEYAIDHRYFLASYAGDTLSLVSQPTDFVIERWDRDCAMQRLRVVMCQPATIEMVRSGLHVWRERNMLLSKDENKLVAEIERGPQGVAFTARDTDLFFAVISEDGVVQGLSRLSAGPDGDVYIGVRAVIPQLPDEAVPEFPTLSIDLEYLAFRFAQKSSVRIDNTRFSQIAKYLRSYPFFRWGYTREGGAVCVFDPAAGTPPAFDADGYFRDLHESGVSIRLYNRLIPVRDVSAMLFAAEMGRNLSAGREKIVVPDVYRTTPEAYAQLVERVKVLFSGARLRGSDAVEYEVVLKAEREDAAHRLFVFELYLYDPHILETGLYFTVPYGYVHGKLTDDTLTITDINLAKAHLEGKGLYRNLFKMIGHLLPAGYTFAAYNILEKQTSREIEDAFYYDGQGHVRRGPEGRPLMRYRDVRDLLEHTFVGKLHTVLQVEPFTVAYKKLRDEEALAHAAEEMRRHAYPTGVMVFSSKKMPGNTVSFERLRQKPLEALAQLYAWQLRRGGDVVGSDGNTAVTLSPAEAMRQIARGTFLPCEIELPAVSDEQKAVSAEGPMPAVLEEKHDDKDYFPLTQEGRRMSRSLLVYLGEGKWDAAIHLFSVYCAKDKNMRKLIEQSGLAGVLVSGSRDDKIALITACLIICPVQQHLPSFGRFSEPFQITLRDGVQLKGLFLRSFDSDRVRHPTVILLSPWSMNIRALRRHTDYFRNAGFNVVLTDHRHHGESRGAFFGLAQTGGADLNEIGRYLLAHAGHYEVDPQYLIAYGASIGGAVTLDAATRRNSPLTHIIVQGTPDITDAFLERNFSKLFFKLPKNMYSAGTIRYIKKLLQCGLLYFHRLRVPETEVFPQILRCMREVRVPCLYIREAGDTLMSDAEYRDKIESLAQTQGHMRVARIGGEHARGHLEDAVRWEQVLDDFLVEHKIPFVSRQVKTEQLLLFESLPAPAVRPARALDDGRLCEEAS